MELDVLGRSIDTFIDDFIQNDGAKMDLTSVIAWSKLMTKDLPLKPKITKEEALWYVGIYLL
jgi:hypothetical protein